MAVRTPKEQKEALTQLLRDFRPQHADVGRAFKRWQRANLASGEALVNLIEALSDDGHRDAEGKISTEELGRLGMRGFEALGTYIEATGEESAATDALQEASSTMTLTGTEVIKEVNKFLARLSYEAIQMDGLMQHVQDDDADA